MSNRDELGDNRRNSDDEYEPASDPSLPSLPLDPAKWKALVKTLHLPVHLARIAEMILRNLCKKQIALRLKIKPSTVRTYQEKLRLHLSVSGQQGIILRIFAEAERMGDAF